MPDTDQQKRDQENPRGRKLWREYGTTGLNRYGGAISEEFINDLQYASSRHKIYSEMRLNSPVIGSILFIIEQALRKIDWMIEPSEEDSEIHEERAEFFRQCKEDMSHTWDDFISECLTFLSQGWALFEVCYKKRLGDSPSKYTENPAKSKFSDGKIGWRKFAIRAQDTLDRWDFDENGGIQGMYQLPPPDYARRYVSIDKALLFRTRVEKGNPEGRSVLRTSYRPWYFHSNFEVIMGVGVERNLSGIPVIYLPQGFEDADYDVARGIVEKARIDAHDGFVLPGPKGTNPEAFADGGWLFELVSGSGRMTFQLVEILEYYDQRMAMTLLAQFLLLGTGNVGSYALSQDQSDLFLMALEGWATMIAEVINRHAIPKLMMLNNWPLEESPKIVPTTLARQDLMKLSKWLETMGMLGFNLGDLENPLRAMADLPLREEGNAEEELEEEPEIEEKEEEEMEKAEEVWRLKGGIPSKRQIMSDWKITTDDIEAVAEEFAKIIGG